ncbi:MAG TPA: M48 family metalloprotease [Pyrinomonadaceae bacterium]|nr:M48 family metalloprotease [Pyrinomonadaceae bacterium]
MLKKLTLLAACALIFCCYGYGQDCNPPAIVANAKSSNLFSPEQEMILGELTVQSMSGEFRLVRDEQLLAYVNGIGERLIKHLPPTGLRFQFHIIDFPEANAFNIPGGHVFLSRKLIAFVNNEDELAGVIAHELGHAAVHHSATDISEFMRKILKINSVGDRKDVTEKYNLLIENARTKRISRSRGHENEQQLEADKIGVFAMVAAGYDPAAFSSFFDRLTENDGKTGSWFGDLFGNIRPEQKRMREMIRATEQLPQTCREGRNAKATENFLQWQADVVMFREKGRKEQLPGLLWKKDLAPRLRSDVFHFAFSPDGKYLLAQDDFAVTILQRQPLQVLFQIPAENSAEATFTAGGRQVVFTTENLRFERWDIAEKKPLEVRELVLRGDCWESELSPDGNFLACVDTATSIKLIDTKTGKKVFEKKEFYPLSFFEFVTWITKSKDDDKNNNSFFRIKFSPDSRYAMFSRSDRYRFRLKFDMETVAASENTAMAIDLTTFKPVEIGGDLKKIASRQYVFLDSERILGMPSAKLEDSGVFSFPNGKRQQKFAFAAQQIKRTSNPNHVIIRPMADGSMGVFDLEKQAVVSGLRKADATMWNNLMALEATSGQILLREVKYNEAEKRFDGTDAGTIEIPVSSINNLNAAEVSDDFKWMALSSKSRGGMWNLETGERKIFVRGFKGVIVGGDGAAVGEFPRLDDMPRSLVLMNTNDSSVVPIRELPAKGSRQHGRFILLRSSLKDKPQKKDEKKNAQNSSSEDDEKAELGLRQEVRFELKDLVQDKVIWTRDFPKEAPRYSFDEFSGRLIFYWRLGSEAGKDALKQNPEMKAKADALGNKADDYMVEVIDAFTQKAVGSLLLETGKGSFNVGSGLSEGDWLVLYDSEGRVLVYSLKNGDLRHRFFGKHAAVNPTRNQIAVENFPGEVNVYNLDTGDRQTNFVINGKAAFVRFNLKGDRLFVLGDTQSAYAFDLNKMSNTEAKK